MIRALSAEEYAAAAHLAAAAYREDPGFAHLIPDDALRRYRLPSLLESVLRVHAGLGGRVMGAFDDGALVGMSFAMPAGSERPSLLDWLPRASGLGWLLADPAGLLRTAAMSAALERLRPAADDSLRLLAVHPATQARGIGGALLRDVLKSGGPVSVETFHPGAAAWFEARGFKRRLEVASHSRPTLWTLRRAGEISRR